jgi:hypothetical protein
MAITILSGRKGEYKNIRAGNWFKLRYFGGIIRKFTDFNLVKKEFVIWFSTGSKERSVLRVS